jgi:predicted dehydrogenase
MSEKILGAAIFGAGWVAGEHAKAYAANPRVELVAVGSRNIESARKCAEFAGAPGAFTTTDFDEILARPDVDIVSITTPPDLHPDLTIRAARAGKHLCIEKPIALGWPACGEMQRAVQEAGVQTIVSFCLHWNPSMQNTKALLEAGAIGEPYYLEVDYWHGMQTWYPQYPWAVTKEQGGNSLLSAGCHALDALRWFAGVEKEVAEVTAYDIAHRGSNTDWEISPTTILMLKWADGTVGKVASSQDCVMPYQFNIDILGTEGTIRDNRLWSRKLFPAQSDWATIPAILPSSGDVSHHPFAGQMEALVASILDGKPSLPDLDDAVKTHEIIFAAEISAREGRPV